MKITLIQCPVWGTYDPPLAIAQLSSCLKKESYEVNCVDLNVELYLNRKVKYKDMWAWEQSDFWYSEKNVAKFFVDNQSLIEAYVNRMLTSGSQVFCFSVSSSSYLASLELAKVLKKRNCDLIIIFGGTLFFDKNWIFKILDNGNIDFVIYGEGETTLTEVVKLISKGSKDFSLIKGIAFKKNDEVFIAPPQPYVDLNSLPFLDFKDLSLEKYDDSNHITLMASRGCVQSCVFCSSKSFWQGYRTMSGERIFEEVKFHRDNYPKIGHIDFVDLLFNGNMKTLISFCNLMVNSGLGNTIRWAANVIIRPEMTLEITKKMKAAGCVHLIYGIETGSQHLLDLMRKRYKIID
ncbi:MAG: hypothetical protein FJZ16_02070, partial [Candidatus Omnitrophica bacterium]|nr:hypothetical protein [Candidatus Omnitrophota bacterium]